MGYDRRFGEREGLAERIKYWVDRASNDKSVPWVGLGLIEDLKTVVEVLEGKPEKPAVVEFDL